MAYREKDTKKWTAQWFETNVMGEKKKRRKRGFETKREALEFERSKKLSNERSMDMKLSDFIEIYFSDKQNDLKDRTIKNKRYMMQQHIVPYFGNQMMSEIKASQIIQWQNEIQKKGYSDSYLRMIQNQLTSLFTHAAKIYDLPVNPCKKVKRMGNSDSRSLNFWTLDEYKQFIKTMEPGTRYYLMFEMLFWTGCRIGELLAITKADINFEKNQLSINKTYYRTGMQDIITEPKTKQSFRTIEIPEFLKEEIKEFVDGHYGMPDTERLFPVVQEDESGNTTIPEYLFIRDLPGRAGGDDGMNMNEKNKIENCRIEPKLKLINMDSVEVEQVEWLLYPFIPYGKVTIIQGDPGEGKTTMVLQIIAKLTRGEPILPVTDKTKTKEKRSDEVDSENEDLDAEDNMQEQSSVSPVNVIYQTAEDGLGDTIKPRLLAAGADCSKVLVIDDSDQPLTMADVRLEEAIVQTKAKMVVLDPIQGFLGADVDMHRANEIRPLMKRIAVLSEKYHCAVILIGHMNKNSNGKSSYRGLGSIDFQAAARSVLIVGRVKDEPEVRVVCHTKSSLAPEGTSIAFRLDKNNGFEWIGEYDISADELLNGDGRGQKSRKAKEFLLEILANGGMTQKKIAEEAEARGIKSKTLWNAKRELEIDSVKRGKQWYWMLPE